MTPPSKFPFLLLLALCWFGLLLRSSAQNQAPKQPSFDSNGVPIHYLVTGREDGDPVVLIHGFAGSISPTWNHVIPLLQKDFKVVALDCRGHGASGKPHDPKLYGPEMVADVARLLDHLHLQKAHIVGYSMGAVIALKFAVRYPERAQTLCLGGTGINRGNEELIRNVASALETQHSIAPLLLGLTPKGESPPSPEQIKAMDSALQATNDFQALSAAARSALTDTVSDEQVAAIRVPVLAIIGSKDPLRPDVTRLKSVLLSTQAVVIENTDHQSAFFHPQYARSLQKFLSEQSRK